MGALWSDLSEDAQGFKWSLAKWGNRTWMLDSLFVKNNDNMPGVKWTLVLNEAPVFKNLSVLCKRLKKHNHQWSVARVISQGPQHHGPAELGLFHGVLPTAPPKPHAGLSLRSCLGFCSTSSCPPPRPAFSTLHRAASWTLLKAEVLTAPL